MEIATMDFRNACVAPLSDPWPQGDTREFFAPSGAIPFLHEAHANIGLPRCKACVTQRLGHSPTANGICASRGCRG